MREDTSGKLEPSRQEMVIALISETVREVRKVPRLSAVFSRQQHSYVDCIWMLKKWEISHSEDFGFSDIR